MVEAQDIGAAIQERPVDMGQHRAEVVRAERTLQAQGAEAAAAIAALVGQESTVLGGADAAVELDRAGDVGRAAARRPRCEPMRRVYSNWLLSNSRPKSKKPWFSVKNGRLSLKKVSCAPKFTTSESLSTWPKSGLIVAVSWNWLFGFQKMSAPASNWLSRETRSCRPTT
jgi:hypothetical protein